MLKDQRGLTLIEMLAAIVIMGLVLLVMGNIFLNIFNASRLYGERIAFQNLSNNMVAQMEIISRKADVYRDAGYLGKYTGSDWQDRHIIKTVDHATSSANEIDKLAQGVNPIYMTDITDTGNQRVESYQANDQNVKIKVIQQKDKNDYRKTVYGLSNYRYGFKIETSGVVLFYKGVIPFDHYYDTATGFWDISQLLHTEKDKIIQNRQFVLTYRDDAKARGEVPGYGGGD